MSLQDGGWIVIQRRVNNQTSFNRSRKEYNVGFGDFNSNFWLGLEKIKRITDCTTFELYIGIHSFQDFPNDLAWAKYGSFSLGTDTNDYKLTISNFDATSTAGNALGDHDGELFSTPDEDNDSSIQHCADLFNSGWWFKSCFDSNLNGFYHFTGEHTTQDGIIWDTFLPRTKSMQTTVMAIRPKA